MNRECGSCGRPMRKQGVLAHEQPGSVTGRGGICYTCRNNDLAPWDLGPHMEPGDELDLDWLTDAALKALIHERRTRGIPAAGTFTTTPKPRTNPLGQTLTQWIERNKP